MDRFDFNKQLSVAAREMSTESTTQGTLERAVQMASEILPRCHAAGVSIVREDSIETRAATTEALREIDELQYEIKQGPCWDALRDTDTVTSVDLGHDQRWPDWGPRVADELGFHSTLSFLLFTDDKSRGVLNLYSREVDGFTHVDVEDGLTLAAHIAVAFMAARGEDQFRAGLANRTVIGQATGMLMERFDLDAATAFGVLVRISQRSNTKIIDLATELVQTGRMEQMGT